MAGDWIKVEHATLDKPEVYEIAEILGISPEEVVGRLLRVWFWFDEQTENGNAVNVTSVTLVKRLVTVSGLEGFPEAMKKVGWLNGSSIPNFDRHNGKSAKSRALTASRVKRLRNAHSNDDVTMRSLPEKRREEKKELQSSSLRSDSSPSQDLTDTSTPEEQNPAKATRSHTRGSRLDITDLPEDWAAFCVKERPDLVPLATFERFRDYWTSQPGVRGRKVDWLATWRNWVRDQKRSNGQGHAEQPAKVKNLCQWPDCTNDSRWDWQGIPYCEQHYTMTKRGERPDSLGEY